MKLTPHDKAILVGLHMGGGSCEGPSDLLTLDLEITRNWFNTTIKDIHKRVAKKELETFAAKMHSVFFCDEITPRYPEEYVDKLSPLAIATWLATNQSRYTQHNWSLEERNKFMIAFRKKWSILLDVDTLRGYTEGDEINLWLLTKNHLQEFAPNMTPDFVARYPRKHKTIYLSGGQQFAKDGGANWRAVVSPELYRAGYDVFNPVFEGQAVLDAYGVNFDQLTLDEYIGAGGMFIEKDLEAIKSSDAVLTLIDESAMRGAGTKSEATIAVDYNIPNFFVLAEGFEARKLPIWLAGCIRNKKFLFEHNDFVRATRALKRSI
jgi:hypothetical protein